MKKGMQFIREYSIPLIAGVVIAVIWANLWPEGYHHFVHTPLFGSEDINFHFLISDIFMVFFFGTAGVEIVNSLAPGGPLNPIKKAVVPLMATAGGVLGPVVVFFVLNAVMGAPEFANGWGIPTATDIALAWLVARLIFGKGHPAVSFLLLLAVADDAVGLFIIAIFYPDPTRPVEPVYLLLVLLAVVIAYFFGRFRVKSFWWYVLIPGVIAWFGMHTAGLHPALALVFIVPFMPRDVPDTEAETRQATLIEFEDRIGPFVDYGLICFGISSAGVEFAEMSSLTWIIFLALVVGKTFGVTLFSYLATLLSFHLPDNMHLKEVILAGCIAGMGLTVALFVADNAYTDLAITGAAKMGALLTASVALLAYLLSKLFRIQKID
ncbi:MAG: Na+/H+ antiporter NhaA [Bacillota bacterium]|nr:Na+/H+ antiporter NhaA [Bacillota bacterium]